MNATKPAQRVLGLLLFSLGVAGTVWLWSTAINDGYFYLKVAILPPILLTMGLAMLVYPIDKERLLAEHGVESVQTLAHYPPAWKGLLALGVLGGIGNVVALMQM